MSALSRVGGSSVGEIRLAAACAGAVRRAESPALGCQSPAQNPFIKITSNKKFEIKISFVSTLGIVKCHRLEISNVLTSIDY